ncbi:MAG TPA: ABC transporter substrate-binding protein [Stellaceae bacterium]|nr:ABC transporter substrate-binding protein [Stellaceae bacterium]
MRRRAVIALAGSAAVALPFAARAQAKAMPVVGYLNGYSPEERPTLLAAFKQSLSDAGFVEGRTVTIEYRWARGQADRLAALAADLAERRVDVMLACGGDASTRAAIAATKTVPIVFLVGEDPVVAGFVASLGRPGGNVTGITLLQLALQAKRVEMLHEMAPTATTIGFLADAGEPEREADNVAVVQASAQKLGLRVRVLKASGAGDLEAAFATMKAERIGALLLSGLPIWGNVSVRGPLIALAARYAIPTCYYDRDQAEAGGLMSYGTNVPAVYRQLGAYAARVLKGDRPADLPVQQPTTFDLVINLNTARSLGLTVPQSLLTRADDVLE